MNGFDRWADATVKTATWQVGWGDADFQHIFAAIFLYIVLLSFSLKAIETLKGPKTRSRIMLQKSTWAKAFKVIGFCAAFFGVWIGGLTILIEFGIIN